MSNKESRTGKFYMGGDKYSKNIITPENALEHEFEKIKEKCVKDKALTQLYSRILDITEEEQIKGKTHEYSILEFTYQNTKFELLDTPGHKAFIRELNHCDK